MSFEAGGWKTVSTNDSMGNTLDDTKVLMLRPDGLPGNVQKQYVEHYLRRGYTMIDDPLDLPDIIHAPDSAPRKKRSVLREERDAKIQAEKDMLLKEKFDE